jgi:hypothetical protein
LVRRSCSTRLTRRGLRTTVGEADEATVDMANYMDLWKVRKSPQRLRTILMSMQFVLAVMNKFGTAPTKVDAFSSGELVRQE